MCKVNVILECVAFFSFVLSSRKASGSIDEWLRPGIRSLFSVPGGHVKPDLSQKIRKKGQMCYCILYIKSWILENNGLIADWNALVDYDKPLWIWVKITFTVNERPTLSGHSIFGDTGEEDHTYYTLSIFKNIYLKLYHILIRFSSAA